MDYEFVMLLGRLFGVLVGTARLSVHRLIVSIVSFHVWIKIIIKEFMVKRYILVKVIYCVKGYNYLPAHALLGELIFLFDIQGDTYFEFARLRFIGYLFV